MFKHHKKRSGNTVFVIFRLILSIVMFAVLVGGVYSAYKHFSGLDPLKLDPVQVLNNLLSARTPKQFIGALPSFKIGPKVLGKAAENENPDAGVFQLPESGDVLFRFLIVADSHNDNANLEKALAQAKNDYPDLKFIIGLGDYTAVGTVAELKDAKKVFDASGLRYFLIPGDHDLWDCRNRNQPAVDCFSEVFGPPYQSFTFDNFEFLLIDNSDDYLGLGDVQKNWVDGEFEKLKVNPVSGVLVFLHEPVYHPSSDHVMGKTEKTLKDQARNLEFSFKDGGVKKVIAGDIHFFSQYDEPVTGLSMTTVGAITTDRNPQAPRFAVVSVLDDGGTKVEDIEIK